MRKLVRAGVLCAVALAAACTPRGQSTGAPPALRLIETVPVETALGDPAVPAALDVWLELIRGARVSLDFEQFYVSTWPGEPLEPVLDAVGAAAARGVRVRFIVDSRMHRTYPRTVDSLGAVPGIEVRIVPIARIAGGVQHAKYFIVDGETVVIGSQNFDWRALKHIHELGVAVREPRLARAFGAVFEMDWGAADPDTARAAAFVREVRAAPPAVPAPPYRVALAGGDSADVWPSWSPHGFIPDTSLWDRDAIVRVLDGATADLSLMLLKYGPDSYGQTDRTLDDALRRAAARGVRVRMLISDWQRDGDELLPLQDLARVPGIEVRLSTIPEWSGGYIPFARVEHCKFVVADGRTTWLGTSNWEPGYWWTSRNLAVTIASPAVGETVRGIFDTSWRAPSAAPLHPDSSYAPKVRGETPPPGSVKYGG